MRISKIILTIILTTSLFQSDGQSVKKVISNSISRFLSKNSANFQIDTLFIQNSKVLLHDKIPDKLKNVKILSYDKMPSQYFEESKFVLGVDTEKKGRILKVILSERNFEYDINTKEWLVSYNGQWVYYFIERHKEYYFQKYTHSSI
jgi:hypothetical protein